MRVRVDQTGTVTAAADDLAHPCIIFPLNWPAADFVGCRVVATPAGVRLLLRGTEVVAQEDLDGPLAVEGSELAAVVAAYLTANPPATPDVGSAVSTYMAAHPIPPPDVAGAVSAYMTAHPIVIPSPDVAGAVAAYFAANPPATTGFTTLRIGAPVTLGLLALGIPVDVTFVWSAPMPSASYTHDIALGTPLIGKANLAVKTKTATQLVVTVTPTAVIAAGGVVVALAAA